VLVNGFAPVSRFADRHPLVRAMVQKPVDLDALLRALHSCIDGGAGPESAGSPPPPSGVRGARMHTFLQAPDAAGDAAAMRGQVLDSAG
jgi:hypothetical protein